MAYMLKIGKFFTYKKKRFIYTLSEQEILSLRGVFDKLQVKIHQENIRFNQKTSVKIMLRV